MYKAGLYRRSKEDSRLLIREGNAGEEIVNGIPERCRVLGVTGALI